MTILLSLSAQSLNDYRSVASGNWDTLATWQYWNGSAWVTPAVRTTSASNSITVRNPHTHWIDGTREYDRNGGNIPLASWRSSSTLNINGLTTTLPGNRTQTFQNLTWNCPGQTANFNSTGTASR